MYDFRRNITVKQRIEYGFYHTIDHFFGRERMFKMFEKRRRKFYKKLHQTLKASGEGKITPIERRKDLSLKEFKSHYVKNGIPVVIEGAARDWDCVKKWSLEYFKELHGKDEITLVNQDNLDYPYEKITLAEVIENIRTGGKKYYRFYPLLERHPEHIKDFDYKWLFSRQSKIKWWNAFQVFIGGKDTATPFHNNSASNLFVQAYGEKKWILYSHYYTPIFDPDPIKNIYRSIPIKTTQGNYYDPFNPNHNYPFELFKYIDGYEANLKPGDILWNPPYYWHAVHNTTDSIGVGYRWLSPFNAFSLAPLYFILDLFARNPPFWKAYKLVQKDMNLMWLAETGKLDEYIKAKKEKEHQEPKQ